MKQQKSLWAWLLVPLLFAGSYAIQYFSERLSSEELNRQYTRSVQSHLSEALVQMEKEGKQIKRTFQENNNTPLVVLSKQLRYEFYIFKNEELVFWSDHLFTPEYKWLSGFFKYRFLDLKRGKFIVYKNSFATGGGNQIEIVCFLPIQVRYEIENAYLQSAYNHNIIPSNSVQIDDEGEAYYRYNLFSPEGQYLFSMIPTEADSLRAKYWSAWSLAAALGAWLLLGLLTHRIVRRLRAQRQHEWAFGALLLFLIAFRIFFFYQLPLLKVFEWDIFNPKFYASSQWSSSLGDLIVSLSLLLAALIHLLRSYYRFKIYKNIVLLPALGRDLLSVLCIMAAYWVFWAHFSMMSTIYLHSQINLDITQELDFPLAKIACLVIFLLLSVIYFVLSNLLVRVLMRLNEKRYLHISLLFATGTFVYGTLSYLNGQFYALLILLGGAYLVVATYLALPKYLYQFRYFTSIYLFLAALICAASGAYSVYVFGQEREHVQMKKYAESLLEENDLYTEFILQEIEKQIQKDAFIKESFQNPFINAQLLRQRIKKMYVKNALDSYQVDVYAFDWVGNSLQKDKKNNYQDFLQRYQQRSFRTEHPNTFFVSENDVLENSLGANLSKQYLHFIEIYKDRHLAGYVILDLKQRKDLPNNVYPELLIDKRFKQPKEYKSYSYAIYTEAQLLYNTGEFNYEKEFKKAFLKFPSLYAQGYEYKTFKHLAQRSEKGRIAVVSAPVYTLGKLYANFSLFFLLLVITYFGIAVLYAFNSPYTGITFNYATRIQIYLNIAFFLPLIIISVFTLSIVSSSYEKDLINSFINKAESAGKSLLYSLEGYWQEEEGKEKLVQDLLNVAQYAEADLNLFDTRGRLIASSQPSIYESGLLSFYINSEAHTAIIEQKERKLMLSEAVGLLNYKSVYIAVYTYDTNRLLGILSIPFFDAEDERDKKIINILSTTINIFTATFIVFMIVSYFASRILTVPLQMITQKIKKTNLQDYNEPLEWDSEDEIGLLVNEYNRMLINLEESKQALAQSEKESAWREMAKQVAHEIKNPLTPMKLTLQHLQMKIEKENIQLRELIAKPFDTLLSQIDTLSDIATSFSTFAKMPTPRHELFEAGAVVRKVVQLFKANHEVDLFSHLAKGDFMVRGDEQLLGQILNNLMLNAIQAVPKHRKPQILIHIFLEQSQNVRIEIRDNGVGIPKEIQNKVFVPNFSTKFTGSGIGLALAKRGIEHAGGKIWFETVEGEGTCFFIDLPLAE
jgi:nitrogen fixation/metabolism regulation signal transduction histidine kinase